jgi:hypothetical protein
MGNRKNWRRLPAPLSRRLGCTATTGSLFGLPPLPSQLPHQSKEKPVILGTIDTIPLPGGTNTSSQLEAGLCPREVERYGPTGADWGRLLLRGKVRFRTTPDGEGSDRRAPWITRPSHNSHTHTHTHTHAHAHAHTHTHTHTHTHSQDTTTLASETGGPSTSARAVPAPTSCLSRTGRASGTPAKRFQLTARVPPAAHHPAAGEGFPPSCSGNFSSLLCTHDVTWY